MALEILSAGPLTTVQDAGRPGYAAGGFQESGAADRYAFTLANLLAGNPCDFSKTNGYAGDAVLECTLKGITARFTEDTLFALTGADMAPTLNGGAVAMFCPHHAHAGDILAMGTAKTGLRGYLAVYGGFSASAVMGSRSTNLKCGIGGFAGRTLKAGDQIPIGDPLLPPADQFWAEWQPKLKKALPKLDFAADGGYLAHAGHPRRFVGGQRLPLFRVVPGPQEEAFTPYGQAVFARGCYTVTADSNRMACKLSGPAVEMVNGADILSDGIVLGSIQISANGQPIVMLADHQTTGGYAKIGTVISADIPAMAQVRPGEKVAFCYVTPGQAVEARRKEAHKLAHIKECLQR